MNDQNNSSEPELLPCPMCGGQADLHEMREYRMAMCNNCGVNYEGPTFEDCATAWNRRATHPPADHVQGGLTEELRQALSTAETGHGSHGPNYDGNKLAASIQAILSRQSMMGGNVQANDMPPIAVPMEPVAYITKRGTVYGGRGDASKGDRSLFLSNIAFALPALQPAGYEVDYNKGFSAGWNACREKVAEINIAPTPTKED